MMKITLHVALRCLLAAFLQYFRPDSHSNTLFAVTKLAYFFIDSRTLEIVM